MEFKNRLNEVPLADLNDKELDDIKKLEEKFNDKYYLIAFKKQDFK
ncbi:hypothetical protein [Caldisalinibacter kiritimatiensis]|uniref:Uncharacterized protein n=1 Tax=Caldisalinibacter kiritimatiensis TaxID=1304284 RepID=R1AY22_9FIRM|nr:hypothetical protein [Caldisalinibacter kiritimatiensis]EOD01557.1 hypothetical protein L21TH_0360 [Caldisalinibacter kiritimatiensis]